MLWRSEQNFEWCSHKNMELENPWYKKRFLRLLLLTLKLITCSLMCISQHHISCWGCLAQWYEMIMCDELEWIWDDGVVLFSRYYPGICLKWLKKTMTNNSTIISIPAEIQTWPLKLEMLLSSSKLSCLVVLGCFGTFIISNGNMYFLKCIDRIIFLKPL